MRKLVCKRKLKQQHSTGALDNRNSRDAGQRHTWTKEEDRIILQMVAAHGAKWIDIAAKLPGRTDHAARNRYHRLQRLYRLFTPSEADVNSIPELAGLPGDGAGDFYFEAPQGDGADCRPGSAAFDTNDPGYFEAVAPVGSPGRAPLPPLQPDVTA